MTMTATFHLTEANSPLFRTHTRVHSLVPSLPVLKSLSPCTFSTQSTSPISASRDLFAACASQPVSPRNKAAERLKRIDIEVKRYLSDRDFEDLFGGSRRKLLGKVRELERSPYVQRDMDTLRSRVGRLREKWDQLRQERQHKEATLQRLLEVATSFQDPASPSFLAKRHSDLLSALSVAYSKLEKERIYSCTLQYMKETRLKQVLSAKEPIEIQRSRIHQIATGLETARDTVMRESLAVETIAAGLTQKTLEIRGNRTKFAQFLQEKAREYRDRSEMYEFVRRFEGQKTLKTRIDSNEETVTEMIERIRAAQEASVRENELATNEKLAEGYEMHLKTLRNVTGASDFAGIVGYWEYLQTNKEEIEGNIAEIRDKVDKLREIYNEQSKELRLIALTTNPEATESLKNLQFSQLRTRKSAISLSNWQEEVKPT